MGAPGITTQINQVAGEGTVKKQQARFWPAHLNLEFSRRDKRTVLTSVSHQGPLRVQRPFYPEDNDCCHVYLLHPPGGLVVGDKLEISTRLKEQSNVLLTTPSAGRIYGAQGFDQQQTQIVHHELADNALLEWLPQETIVYNGAQGHLAMRVDLAGQAKFFGWDIVRLGRAASGEEFTQGHCTQKIEIWRNERLEFVERNCIRAGGQLQRADWGLQNSNTFGTLLASISIRREQGDEILSTLERLAPTEKNCWGLTQREQWLIVRYLGRSVLDCRKGFEWVWKTLRHSFSQREAVPPRIWNT